MRVHNSIFIAIVTVFGSFDGARAAEFNYGIDATVYYQGEAPIDGKYKRENFLVTATPRGIAPKSLNVYAEFSTGPGTPLLEQVSCSVGEIQPEWTVTYRGVSCNWPVEIAVPFGKQLYASMSYAFGPFAITSPSTTLPVIAEAVRRHPGNPPATCEGITRDVITTSDAKSRVTVNVYQLSGAVSPDGTLDQTKICVVATPHGQDVTGLRLWGSLTARKNDKEQYVGSYLCIIANAPDTNAAEKTVVCSPSGNNNAPDIMVVPQGAQLHVATTATFGRARTASRPATPVQKYGPPSPGSK
jgi:hypothetical protein